MFTLVLPALLRRPHEPVPPLAVPALNDLLRYGRFQAAPLSRGALYQFYCCDRLTLPENQIYASPVWQRMGMNSADMLALHDIRTDEAQAWCAELTAFYENRYTFRPLRPDLWTLELPAPPQWQADSIWNVCGQLDGTQTAHGADTREWLRLTTEIQMWLHNHPHNAKREAAGQPPANGLWLWNAPTPQPFQAAPYALSGCGSTEWHAQSSRPWQQADGGWAEWQAACRTAETNPERTLVFRSDFTACADTGDIWHYQALLEQWEHAWFAPLRTALFSGSLNGLEIVCEAGRLTVGKHPQRRFWKRKKTFNGTTF